MENRKYFMGMLISVSAIFLLTCFSIIYCIINSSNISQAQSTSHMMSIVFMMIQLIVEATVFYYAFKAMVKGSSLIKLIMFEKDNIPNLKSKRNSLIVFIFSTVLAVYFVVLCFPVEIFLSFFALGLKFAIMNFFSLLAIVALYFYAFKNPEEAR